MRIIFMGTPEFAVPSLEILGTNRYLPVAVATGADKRRGRGRKLSPTPVKKAAQRLGVTEILQPASVKDPDFATDIAELLPDLIVVVAFRILPPAVYESANLGAFNLHGSLLPKYRGAAPIHHAVLNGDTETGVTTFFLQQKVDTGKIILKKTMPIGPDETTGDVHDRMMHLGAKAVLETVQRIDAGTVTTSSQDESLATPAPRVFKEQALVDWNRPAGEVHNHIRGYSPVPGAWTIFDDAKLRLLRSRVVGDLFGEPGTVLHADRELVVACGTDAVQVDELQLEGRKVMEATDFLNGTELSAGYKFPSESVS